MVINKKKRLATQDVSKSGLQAKFCAFLDFPIFWEIGFLLLGLEKRDRNFRITSLQIQFDSEHDMETERDYESDS